MRTIAWICITFSIAMSVCLIVTKPLLLTPWIIFLISCVQADLFIFSKNYSKNENSTPSSNQNTNNSATEKEEIKTKDDPTWRGWWLGLFLWILIIIGLFVGFFFVFLGVNWVDNKTKTIALAKFQ